jgi:hypothetical protein
LFQRFLERDSLIGRGAYQLTDRDITFFGVTRESVLHGPKADTSKLQSRVVPKCNEVPKDLLPCTVSSLYLDRRDRLGSKILMLAMNAMKETTADVGLKKHLLRLAVSDAFTIVEYTR